MFVLFFCSSRNSASQTRRLIKQKLIHSQFRRLEVWNWGFGRAGSFLGALNEGESDPYLPAGGCQKSLVFLGLWGRNSNLCSHFIWQLLCVTWYSNFSSYKDSCHWIRSHHNPVWPSAKILFLNKVTFTRTTGVRTQRCLLGGYHSIHDSQVHP